MNIDDLTIRQARELANMFHASIPLPATKCASEPSPTYVIVCTDKRGVVFGATTDVLARPITLTSARMCLYWSADVGGVFGLAEIGPTKDCRISAPLPSIALEGVTAIMTVDDAAAMAWLTAKVHGRK